LYSRPEKKKVPSLGVGYLKIYQGKERIEGGGKKNSVKKKKKSGLMCV